MLARSPLRVAVKAAIDAYALTGRMLDAALAYAVHGYPIFPLTVDKKPVPRRDPDPTRKYPNGIPGTGSFYKSTCDEQQIRKWWKHNEHLIGLPMGPWSGVWALDVDTDDDHADDGVGAWCVLIEEHGDITTREHRTTSKGLHLIFNWSSAFPLGCSAGSLPKGMEVKGKGGYIVVPPSRRNGRAYTVDIDIDPVNAPTWLTKIIGTPKHYYKYLTGSGGERLARPPDKRTPAQLARDIKMLRSAMPFIPNNDLKWDDWTSHGLAFYAATNGSREGEQFFDEFSEKSKLKYDPLITDDRWSGICGSPPDHTGINKLFKIAMNNGWTYELTEPLGVFIDLIKARSVVSEVFDDLINYLKLRNDPEAWNEYVAFFRETYEPWEQILPPVKALKIGTGIGKTTIGVEKFSETKYCILVTTPTINLAEKIEAQFTKRNIDAAVYRGRNQDDPNNPGSKMCLDPERVELAVKAYADVNKTCCNSRGVKCPLIEQCGYWSQKQRKPQVWIAASNVLFHKQDAIGRVDAVIADESFWQKSLVGLDQEEKIISMPLAVFACGSVEEQIIAQQLAKQIEDGGVWRDTFIEYGKYKDVWDDLFHRLISQLWEEVDQLQKEFHPQMKLSDLKKKSKVISDLALTHEKLLIVKEIRTLVRRSKNVESGRLLLGEHRRQRVISWRGVKEINKQFEVPTMLLDATLPDRKVLKLLHPQVEIMPEVKVPMSASVSIKVFRDAPTSDKKLGNPKSNKHASSVEKNRRAIRRHILKRWFETGRQRSLVICQQDNEEWLRDKLPKEIETLHFNALAGLDEYKDVRLQIEIGRVQPGPEAIEAIAGTLTGVMPIRASYRNPQTGFTWYNPVIRNISLRDGSGVPVFGDQHPDPMGECVRWLICEAEEIQGDGRARGVNRNADSPLDIDRLHSVVLDDVVNEVVKWEAPSLWWETIVDGVMLTSPVDMVKVWPDIWTRETAKQTVAGAPPELPGFVEVLYQLAGPKMNLRTAYFDLSLIPEPRQWLAEKLGPLVPIPDRGERRSLRRE